MRAFNYICSEKDDCCRVASRYKIFRIKRGGRKSSLDDLK